MFIPLANVLVLIFWLINYDGIKTGKSGLYMEVTVRFPADGGNADYVGDHLDVNIFQTLSES